MRRLSRPTWTGWIVAAGMATAMMLVGQAAAQQNRQAGPDAIWNVQPDKPRHLITLIGNSYIDAAIRVGWLKQHMKQDVDVRMIWWPAVETAYYPPVLDNEIQRDQPSVIVFLFRHNRLTQPHYFTDSDRQKRQIELAYSRVYGHGARADRSKMQMLERVSYNAPLPLMDSWNFNQVVERSFVPYFISEAKKVGAKLVFIRQPSDQHLNEPIPAEALQYGRDAKAYFDRQGVVFLDYYAAHRELRMQPGHWAKGDHFSKQGAEHFTPIIARELDAIVASLPAPRPTRVSNPTPWPSRLSPQTIAQWDERLATLAPNFGKFHWSGADREAIYTLEGVPFLRSSGSMTSTAPGRVQETINYNRMTGRDRANIAVGVATRADETGRNVPEAHALAAFYLMAIGEADAARAHLEKAGPHAAQVRAAFQ